MPLIQQQKDFEKYRTFTTWGIFLFGLAGAIAFMQVEYYGTTTEGLLRYALTRPIVLIFGSLDVFSLGAYIYLENRLENISDKIKEKFDHKNQN